MYSEHNSRSTRRVNDEFLRRMVGGELKGGARPAMNELHSEEARGQATVQHLCNRNDGNDKGCSTTVSAPSLAMVYAPEQCWRNLLEYEAALKNGSLFAELIMPFEGGHQFRGTGGKQ